MEKKCSQCKKVKDESEYYLRLGKRVAYCKVCSRKYSTAYYYRNREQRLKDSKKRYEKSKERLFRKVKDRSKKKNVRKKILTRTTTRNAIYNGKIEKKPCQECGNKDSQAHHENYDKPFEIIWLCKNCHHKLHRKWSLDKALSMYKRNK